MYVRAATAWALSASSLTERDGIQFIRNDPKQILLQRQLIDNRERVS